MRIALEFAVVVVVASPFVGMLAGHLRARAVRQNRTASHANSTLT
jgi:hypothetical protein